MTSYFRLRESLLMDDTAQESESRKSVTFLETRVKGCHQSVTHKSCLRVQFLHTHTTLSSKPLLFSLPPQLNRTGANHVRTIFTVYVGLIVCKRLMDIGLLWERVALFL